MTEPKLKPCPFCGSKEVTMYEHNDYEGAFYVLCEVCGAVIGTTLDYTFCTEEEIAKMWKCGIVGWWQNDLYEAGILHTRKILPTAYRTKF